MTPRAKRLLAGALHLRYNRRHARKGCHPKHNIGYFRWRDAWRTICDDNERGATQNEQTFTTYEELGAGQRL